MRKSKLPKIHWTVVIKAYPLAWQKFWTWLNDDHRGEMCDYDMNVFSEITATFIEYDTEVLENMIMFGDLHDFVHFNRGDLYSFFDQHQVYLSVSPVMMLGTSEKRPNEWICTVHMINDKLMTRHVSSSGTRPSAEEHGFLAAFKLLNIKLNKN